MGSVDFSWLGLRSAWYICGLLSCWYVGSLYVLVPKHLRDLKRRDPRQIRARSICALLSCVISWATLTLLAKPSTDPYAAPMVVWMGLWCRWETFIVVMRTVLLSMSSYLGSIIANTLLTYKLTRYEVNCMGEERMLAPNKRRPFFSLAVSSIINKSLIADDPWAALRNLIVGPASEEVVFRGIFIPLLVSNGASIFQIIFVAPLLFGASHIHHLYDSLRNRISIVQAIVNVVVQLGYTSMFGAYVSFLFLRYGHLATTIVAHIICNFMGLPNFRFAVPPNTSKLETISPMSILYPFATLLWMCYALGIAIFFLLLFPLTEDLTERNHLWYTLKSNV